MHICTKQLLEESSGLIYIVGTVHIIISGLIGSREQTSLSTKYVFQPHSQGAYLVQILLMVIHVANLII